MTTAFGKWSALDLQSFIAAEDFAQKQLAQHYANFAPQWVASDAPTFEAWTLDWSAMKDRYQAARARAEAFLGLASLEPDALMRHTDASYEFEGVVSAIKQRPGTVTAGDFDDLDKRLQIASGAATSYEGMPQPEPGTDVDLNLYNSLPDFGPPPTDPASFWPSWAKPAAIVVATLAAVAALKKYL